MLGLTTIQSQLFLAIKYFLLVNKMTTKLEIEF